MESGHGPSPTDPIPTARLAEALAALAAVAPPNREEWLRAEFPGDAATQAELLSLVTELSPLRPGREAAAATEDPWIGRSVAGCTVEALLGRGGMGTVYRAHQRSTNRMVALKLLGGGAMPGFMAERLRAEGAALGRLEHHNIARVYQAGVAVLEGTASPFLVMELVPGARTADRWWRSTGLGPRERIERIARCCDAVQHAHARGIIHGDVKPANVLFGPDDEPKLIDFGTARMAGAIDRPAPGGIHALSPAWAAPEQTSAERPSASALTDVYGLGRVAREALEGEPSAALARRQRRDLAAIIARATAHRPEDRHPTADALACELRDVAADRPVRSRHSPLPERVARLARRHPVPMAAALLGLAALAAGGVVMFRSDRAMRRAYAISQLSQATIALDGGNREAALAHAALARGAGIMSPLLPRMIERQADLASDRMRGFGGALVLDAAMTDESVFAAGDGGIVKLSINAGTEATTISRRPCKLIALTPDRSTIIAVDNRDSVFTVNIGNADERTIAKLDNSARSLDAASSHYAVVGLRGGKVCSVDLESGRTKTLQDRGRPNFEDGGPSVVVRGDSTVLAACFDGKLFELEVTGMREPREIRSKGASNYALAIHPSSGRFVSGGDPGKTEITTMFVGQAEPGARARDVEMSMVGERADSAAFSASGTQIGVGLRDGRVWIQSVGLNGKLRLIPLGSNRPVTWCAFDRTDTYLVAAVGDSVVRTPVHPAYPPEGRLGLGPRGTWGGASTIIAWDNGGAACTLDPRTGGVVRWPDRPGPIEAGSASASPDGSRLASFRDGRVVIRDAAGERATAPLGAGDRARTAWLPDGGALWAIHGQDAWILDRAGTVLASGRIPGGLRLPSLVVRPDGHALVVDADRSWALRRDGAGIVAEEVGVRGTRAWPAGDGLLVTTATGSVRWTVPEDPDARTEREFGDPSHAVITAAYSPEQGLVAGGCSDRKVRVWDFRTGEQLVTFAGIGRGPPAVHWLEGGRVLVAIDLDGLVHTWTDLPVEPVGQAGGEAPVNGASG